MSEVEELTRQLATERERADYAWRNARTIEAARQEEMRKRDAAEAENARLRTLLRQGMRQLAAWQEKYGDWQPEWLPPAGDVRWAEDASEALATPNVELRGGPPTDATKGG
jgi:chromosome segregation ATPase